MKRAIIRWMLLLSCGFSAFGCSNLELAGLSFTGKKSHSSPRKNEIFTLLDYFRYLDSLSKEALDEEHNDIQKLFPKERKLLNRLKLAILLSWPNTPYQDYARSLDLLTKYSEDPAREDRLLRDLSFFLSYFIQRIKSEEERHQDLIRQLNEAEVRNEKLQGQGKKDLDQKRRLKSQNKKLKKTSSRLKEENKKQTKELKNLQKMIDGLKSIEKNLMKRDQAKPDESGDKNDE